MKYIAMIQARYGSSRLPGKILKDLFGKPVLQRVIERVSQSNLLNEVMVVTSIDKQNLPVLRLCANLGVRVFVGSENDVLDRYYQAATLVGAQNVIRITADCPCFDAKILDEAIMQFEKKNADYIGQFTDTFPDGLDVEAMTYAALKESWENAYLKSEREHVTQYVRNRPEHFHLENFICPVTGVGTNRWTLDEPEDYELILAIYEHFINLNRENFSWIEVSEFLRDNPKLKEINSKFVRNEGLIKSLSEDKPVKNN